MGECDVLFIRNNLREVKTSEEELEKSLVWEV